MDEFGALFSIVSAATYIVLIAQLLFVLRKNWRLKGYLICVMATLSFVSSSLFIAARIAYTINPSLFKNLMLTGAYMVSAILSIYCIKVFLLKEWSTEFKKPALVLMIEGVRAGLGFVGREFKPAGLALLGLLGAGSYSITTLMTTDINSLILSWVLPVALTLLVAVIFVGKHDRQREWGRHWLTLGFATASLFMAVGVIVESQKTGPLLINFLLSIALPGLIAALSAGFDNKNQEKRGLVGILALLFTPVLLAILGQWTIGGVWVPLIASTPFVIIASYFLYRNTHRVRKVEPPYAVIDNNVYMVRDGNLRPVTDVVVTKKIAFDPYSGVIVGKKANEEQTSDYTLNRI